MNFQGPSDGNGKQLVQCIGFGRGVFASLELCVAVWVKKSFWGNKALITVKGVGGSAATGG